MTPRSKKAKGTKLERWIVTELGKLGVEARKQPGSGIYKDFPHDVHMVIPGCDDSWIIEAKSWRHGWRTGDKAMGKADLLIMKRDHGDPCVYMPWKTFEQIIFLLTETCPFD